MEQDRRIKGNFQGFQVLFALYHITAESNSSGRLVDRNTSFPLTCTLVTSSLVPLSSTVCPASGVTQTTVSSVQSVAWCLHAPTIGLFTSL